MKSRNNFFIFGCFFILFLVACSPTEQAIQEGLKKTQDLVEMDSSTPEPTLTFTPEPTFTSTATPTQTPTITPTPTQAVISTTNLESLALVKSLGNKDTFSSLSSISLSRSGDMLAISGPIDHQITSIIYDTSNFAIMSTFPNLNNLVFSSDGSSIAGNNNGNIEIWEISSDKTTLEFEGSTNAIKELAWSSDKGELAGVDTENTLLIWESDTGKLIFSQQLPEPLLFSEVKLEYSFSGNFLSIIGFDSTLRIWDGERIHILKGHSDIVTHSSWSPDEQFLATGSDFEENAFVWRMVNFNKIFHFSNHQYAVDNLAWSPTGDKIATVDAAGTIKLWNAYTGGLSHSFAYFASPQYIAWSPDGSKIACLYNDNEIKVYDISTKQEYDQPGNFQNANYGLLWVDESILLFNRDSRMQLWNVQSGETEMFINPEFGIPAQITLSPNGKTLAFVEQGGNVLIVDVESEEILFNIHIGITYGISDVAWSSDNKLLGIGISWEEKVIVINAETGIIHNTFEHGALRQYIYLAWSKHNNELLAGAGEGKIMIWDIETSEILHVLEMHETAIMDIEISQDGKKLAAIGVMGEINVWNTSDWSRDFILQGPNDFLIIADLSFSPDGNKIASSGVEVEKWNPPETRYQIWDCNAQELINEWNYGELTNSIAFSPDGLILASSSGSIWDYLTGELLFNKDYDGGRVLWTPDNKFVIFNDNLVDFWGVSP